MTWRIRGNAINGLVYFTGRAWHWDQREARTWKTSKGATAALARMTRGSYSTAKTHRAEVEEVKP